MNYELSLVGSTRQKRPVKNDKEFCTAALLIVRYYSNFDHLALSSFVVESCIITGVLIKNRVLQNISLIAAWGETYSTTFIMLIDIFAKYVFP